MALIGPIGTIAANCPLLTTMPAICCWLPCVDAKTAASVARRRHSLLRLWLMFKHAANLARKLLLCWSSFRGLLTITPVKAIDAAGRINQLLLARKKRMAGRANLNMEIALARRTRLKSLAAGAGNSYFFIFGVNSGFHILSHLLIVIV